MKKIINGSVCNTETAQMICADDVKDSQNIIELSVKLYKTKSSKYFLHTEGINIEDEIELISYDDAFNFAKGLISDSKTKPIDIGRIDYFFPEINEKFNEYHKVQKKIYLSDKTSWMLDKMVTELGSNNGEIIEELIVKKYESLLKKKSNIKAQIKDEEN